MSYIKDVDLPRHPWDTPRFLLIVSPTPPVQSVDAYVRSVNHVTPKRKEVDHIPWVWGSVPRALRPRGSPAIIDSVILLFAWWLQVFLSFFKCIKVYGAFAAKQSLGIKLLEHGQEKHHDYVIYKANFLSFQNPLCRLRSSNGFMYHVTVWLQSVRT